MRAHLAPGHDDNGKPAKNWDLDALAGAGAIRSTANDMLRYLKANMGRDPSPLAAAMKFAQEPRRDMNRNMRIGLAWIRGSSGTMAAPAAIAAFSTSMRIGSEGLSFFATRRPMSTTSASPCSIRRRG
jgi:CubicO group peptidase (beta-lactamase class C family)